MTHDPSIGQGSLANGLGWKEEDLKLFETVRNERGVFFIFGMGVGWQSAYKLPKQYVTKLCSDNDNILNAQYQKGKKS
jgi:hypothetical protein